jgi:hypothetical protein
VVEPGGGTATVTAQCPSDSKVIAGGARFEDSSGNPSAAGTNDGATLLTLRVQAICQDTG